MSYWNYRIIKKKIKDAGGVIYKPVEHFHEIHEVYYNNNNDITAHTEMPMCPYGETVKELQTTLEQMLQACDRKILIEDEIVFVDRVDD